MENCTKDTYTIIDDTPLTCNGVYTSTSCIATPTPITFLNLPAESTQSEINAALVVQMVQVLNKIIILQNRVTALENV